MGPEEGRGDQYLSYREVSQRLRVSVPTIRRWVSSGGLPAVRLGERCVRIKRADLDRFIEQSQHKVAAR